ncbi:GntR family transcriptional regulator [Spongiactinospora sp. TRM90649]|uniref:GntR family transcriptional regulator n=1 Tax=Spongiactinospora sp. TRM90649 TaxID=3031114 RepID=UPI0023F97B12|nr:GntR family transcriptional regulator [Spongiactinospora sp. TRM90649]MDF5757651.1 GntR family transcriptional regulator [Spongiactinospora sp. TRM90649]
MTPGRSSDRSSETRARLLDLIHSLPQGARIASERDLAKRWGVARMTLRKAIDRLVLEDLLERRQRRGTYTCRPRVRRPLTITSFTEEMTRRGIKTTSRTLALRRMRATTEVSRRLRVPQGESVIRFTRLRQGDGEPVAIETNYVPAGPFQDLTEEDLDGSWYAVMAEKYGVDISAGTAEIQPALPDERTAELLGITVGDPCFRICTTVRDRKGRVIEYGESIYRGDYYTITVDLMPS